MCALPTPPAVWIRRRSRRRRDRLMMVACVLEILDLDDEEVVVGRTIGSTNIRRTRKKVKDMWKELGCYARKAYRMNMDSLKKLHSLLLPALRDEFDIKGRSRGKTPNGNISTLLRLSAAIRFFAGGSVYDIMLSHGMGKQSVYKSVYGVVNAVNATAALAFNDNGAEFPSHEEQREIAAGFRAMSAADFDKIILTLDGMLVWTTQPSAAECELIEIEYDERQAAVSLDSNGIPSALVGSGHHFRDAPRGRRPRRNNNDLTPMRKMIRKVADADLRRPAF
mmetsp:Transcript_8527/g.12462  ORF Transcript_8527/g.12462 Transcript_8527/m.12462 type:complete len:280 (+) Transcript_8527:160-999(+)